MDAWRGIDITSMRTSFYNFVYTGNLFNLREGEKRGRGREIVKFARQNNKIFGDAQGH
jgi:hypothetical protein